MPRIPGVNHQDAVRALEKAGFQVIRQGKHIVMSNGTLQVTIPRNNPIKAFTMGGIARDAGLSPEELRRLKGRAIHVHISDCDGKVHGDLPPGRGVVDFGPYLREIKDLGIDGAVSIELEYAPEPERIAEWVREAYEATDRLMRAAGLRG